DDRAKAFLDRLLLTEFATELRPGIAVPADGRRPAEDPVFVRAQLASLLREVGLSKEAEAEGRAVLSTLRQMPEPRPTDDAARHHLRARARALEAIGDQRGAAQAWGIPVQS